MTVHPRSPTLAQNTSTGIALMLLAILTFTTMDALAKGLIARYPTPQVIWIRFAGQLVIVGLILRARTGAMLRTRFPLLHIARSACQLGATGFFFAGLGHIGLAAATALTDLNPVLITLGAALFLGERLGPRRIAGVLVAMSGAMIIIRPGSDLFTPAAILPLCAAFCYAGAALLTRYVGSRESHWTPLLYSALFGTLVMGLTLPTVWQPVAAADLPLFLAVGGLGTFAQLCLIRSFAMTEASVVAPFAYAGILFASLWGMVLYSEYPDRWTVTGALVIVGAGLYVWQREMQAAQAAGRTG